MELKEMNIKEITEQLAAGTPAPGGGSAAALAGALGASLAAMVGSVTLDRPKYEPYAATAERVQRETRLLKDALLECSGRDTEVYLKLTDAFALPKETPEEKDARNEAIQAGLIDCIETPMQVIELCLMALKNTQDLLNGFNTSASSDLGVAALLLKAALQGAWLNVRTNLKSLKDREKAAAYTSHGRELMIEAILAADLIYQQALEQI